MHERCNGHSLYGYRGGSVEACDGLDNDCDTLIDEDFDLATDVSTAGPVMFRVVGLTNRTCRASECVLVRMHRRLLRCPWLAHRWM